LGFPSCFAGPKGTKGFSLSFRLCFFLLLQEIFYPFNKFEEFEHTLVVAVKHGTEHFGCSWKHIIICSCLYAGTTNYHAITPEKQLSCDLFCWAQWLCTGGCWLPGLLVLALGNYHGTGELCNRVQ
jgi:hypothetical protein